jgi:CDGSH-type Zn-finger protein
MNFSYSSKDINKKKAPNSICECFKSKNKPWNHRNWRHKVHVIADAI